MFLSTTAQAKELALCFRYRTKLPLSVQRFVPSCVFTVECYMVTGPLIRRPAAQVSYMIIHIRFPGSAFFGPAFSASGLVELV